MVSHGGQRPGAGRKPTLTPLERLAIGVECERLWQEKIRQAEARALRQVIDGTDLGEVRRKAKDARDDLPRRRRAPPRSADNDAEIFEALEDDVDEEVFAVTGSKRRHLTIRVMRPNNVKGRIVSTVTDNLTGTDGARITQRLVSECWKEYRAILRRIAKE